jgi:hypothetical protein
MKIKRLSIIIFIAIVSGFFGYRFGLSESGNFLKSIVEPGSMVTEASYVIFTDGTNVYARNGNTGEIEFSGADASIVINNALNVLTPGRTWIEKVVLRGSFTLNKTVGQTYAIQIPSYTELDATQATLTLADYQDADMLQNKNRATYDTNIIIRGGLWLGNKAKQNSGNGFNLKNSNTPPSSAYPIPPFQIIDSRIENQKEDGIRVDFTGASWDNRIWITGVHTRYADGYGVHLIKVYDSLFTHSHFGGNGRGFYYENGGSSYFSNVYFPSGVILKEVYGSVFTGSRFEHGHYSNPAYVQHALIMRGSKYNSIGDSIVTIFGDVGATNKDGIYLESSGSVHSTNNVFDNLYIGRTAANPESNRWNRCIHETDSNQSYNTYGVINGRDCVTSALRKLGPNSTYSATLIQGSVETT